MENCSEIKNKYKGHQFQKQENFILPHSIILDGSFHTIHYAVDTAPFVLILCETENELDNFKIIASDYKLHISQNGHAFTHKTTTQTNLFGRIKSFFSSKKNTNQKKLQPVVIIGVQELPVVKLDGSGLFESNVVKQDDLKIRLFGSGMLNLSGQVNALTCDISGSGYIDCANLDCSVLNAKVDGSGMISAKARSSATAKVIGSGTIEIHGKPSIKAFENKGSGLISCKP